MNITIQPTPVKDLKPGDLFRAANGLNFKIKDIDRTDEVVEIEYYIGTRDHFASFFVNPDRVIDVIKDSDTEDKLLTLRPTNGADLAPKDRIRLNGALYDVIDNQVHARGNHWNELTVREGRTGEFQTIEYTEGTIFDLIIEVQE